MSNHFSDPNLAPDTLRQMFETAPEGLGATGRYPEGKLGEMLIAKAKELA